ncbi:Dos2-interacting transcription regulator of RNA-Pol-II-domain-containing protein, partial [Obelidium mucronatum]
MERFFAAQTPAQQAAAVAALAPQPLLAVVAQLGGAATSADPFERAKAVALLSQLLARNAAADKKSVSVLMEFYLARLHDATSVPELVDGILSMLKSGLVARKDAIDTARAFFKELNVQNYAQTVRFSVYCVFECLLKSHLDAMKYLGDQFIAGFLVAMDGEKDPRNILISFSIIQTIVVNFDITVKYEDVFESIYCYFPITFRPPPNDPYGITSADLKLKLRSCFSASPLFGKLAWPILIEKLSSTSDNAKLDAMETIAACAPVYGGSSIGKSLEELWEHLKEESLDAKPAAQKDAALAAVTAVTYALSTDAAASSIALDGLSKFLTFVEKYAVGELISATAPKESVRRLLKASAKATEPAFFKLVTTVIKPFLESLKGNSDTMESRAEKYAVFHDFLEISEGFYGDVSSMDDDSLPLNPLIPFKDDLYQYFSSALSSKNNRVITAGLHGLSQLSILRGGFMTALELEWYFETLLGLVINENNAVRQVAISLLTVESQRRVDKVLLHIVPQLLEAAALEGKEEPVLNSLECLVALCGASATVYADAIPKLTAMIEALSGLSLIHPIATALEIISSDQTSVVPEFDYIKYLFAPLLRSLVSRKVESGFLYSDFVLVESVGRTFASVIRVMDQREQERVAELVTKTLYLRDVFRPGIAHSESNLLIIIFSAVISNLRAEAKVPNADISALLNWLTQEAVTKGAISDQVKAVYLESVYHVVSSVLNKADGSVVSKFVFENAELYKLVENSQSLKVRQSAICLVLWITRATVMKKPSADELAKVTGLIDLLKGSDGGIIASNFYILSADDPSFGKQILTKE